MQSVRLLGLLIGLRLAVNPSIANYAITPAATSSIVVLTGAGRAAAAVDSVHCVNTAGKLDDAADSALTGPTLLSPTPRWPLSASRELTVKIADAPTLPGWTPSYRDEVVAALRAWGSTSSPVAFQVVTGSAPTDIVIHWVDHFDAPYDGWTTVTWEPPGRIVTGDVGLAVRNREGGSLSQPQREQFVLHEIGHVLGLSHSYSAVSIMRGQIKLGALTTDDIQALRRLYASTSPAESGPPYVSEGGTTHSCTIVLHGRVSSIGI